MLRTKKEHISLKRRRKPLKERRDVCHQSRFCEFWNRIGQLEGGVACARSGASFSFSEMDKALEIVFAGLSDLPQYPNEKPGADAGPYD